MTFTMTPSCIDFPRNMVFDPNNLKHDGCNAGLVERLSTHAPLNLVIWVQWTFGSYRRFEKQYLRLSQSSYYETVGGASDSLTCTVAADCLHCIIDCNILKIENVKFTKFRSELKRLWEQDGRVISVHLSIKRLVINQLPLNESP